VNRFRGRSGAGSAPAHGLAPQNLSPDKHVDVCADSDEDRGSTPLASRLRSRRSGEQSLSRRSTSEAGRFGLTGLTSRATPRQASSSSWLLLTFTFCKAKSILNASIRGQQTIFANVLNDTTTAVLRTHPNGGRGHSGHIRYVGSKARCCIGEVFEVAFWPRIREEASLGSESQFRLRELRPEASACTDFDFSICRRFEPLAPNLRSPIRISTDIIVKCAGKRSSVFRVRPLPIVLFGWLKHVVTVTEVLLTPDNVFQRHASRVSQHVIKDHERGRASQTRFAVECAQAFSGSARTARIKRSTSSSTGRA